MPIAQHAMFDAATDFNLVTLKLGSRDLFEFYVVKIFAFIN